MAPKDTASSVGVTRQPDDTLGLVIRADSFDLAFAEPFLPKGTAEELVGHVAADGRISGTMKSPVVAGTVRVTGFGASLPTLGVRYQKAELAGRLADDRFQLERLHLVTDNDGELTVQGNVTLSPLDDPSLDLTADLREFRVSHSATLRAIASGKLRLEGTAAKPVMTGDLELGRTDVYTGTETAAASGVEKVELTPEDLQRLAREFGPAVLARANEGPGLVDRFKLDLDVRLPQRVWFRRRRDAEDGHRDRGPDEGEAGARTADAVLRQGRAACRAAARSSCTAGASGCWTARSRSTVPRRRPPSTSGWNTRCRPRLTPGTMASSSTSPPPAGPTASSSTSPPSPR